MDVKGMVFKNEHETNGDVWYSYNLSVSSKGMDGEWNSVSVPIRLSKGMNIPNKTRIEIKEGWPIVIKGKEKNMFGFFVKEYEVITKEPEGFSKLVDEDIPF